MAKKGKYVSGPNLTSPEVRVSYAYVFEPRANGDDDEKKKCSITLMLDKTNPEHKKFVEKYHQALKDTMAKHWPDPRTRPRNKLIGDTYSPIKDGDTTVNKNGIPLKETDPYYEGHWLIRASNVKKPRVVRIINNKLHKIQDTEVVYGGCWCQVNINPYTFEIPKGSGVTNGLNGVLFTKDDEPFGSSIASAEEMFGYESADFDDYFSQEDNFGTGSTQGAMNDDDIPF
jgi:hypothetical protein